MSGFFDLWTSSASNFARLPLFPVFQAIHYVATLAATRESRGAVEFATSHPLASFVSTAIACSGGTLALNILLGLPLAAPFAEPAPIALMAILWWLIFHCPGDYFYKLIASLPVQIFLVIGKEFRRARMIAIGMAAAKVLYPNQWIILVIGGTLKSTGSKWAKTVERLIRNAPDSSEHELLGLSFVSKASFACSVLYVLNELEIGLLPLDQLMLACGFVLSTVRLSTLLLETGDPFVYVEKVLARLLLRQKSVAVKKSKSE